MDRPTHPVTPRAPSQTLERLPLGMPAYVVAVGGGATDDLAFEGLAAGERVVVESRTPLGGPLVVLVGRARVAVARPVAREVLVEGVTEVESLTEVGR